jgi:cytochrome c peroxidase
VREPVFSAMRMRRVSAWLGCALLVAHCKPSLRDPHWQPRPTERMIQWFRSLNYQGFRGTTPYELGYPEWYISRNVPKPAMTHEAVQLGRFLFYDTALSSDGTVSCSSCHQQKYSFSDNRRFSIGVKGRVGKRNSMHLLNLVMDRRFFWDGRAASLEEQVLMPITDENEMDLPLEELIARLKQHPIYPALFERAYGSRDIDTARIADALAQFVKSIVSYSTADDYLRAYEDGRLAWEKIPANVRKLWPVYQKNVTVMNCGPCHTLAMEHGQNMFDDVGLEADPKDVGYYTVTGNALDKGKFKTPSIRNLQVTAPYMHDGRFDTFEAVLEHYRKGMVRKSNISPFYLDSQNRIRSETLTEEQVKIILNGLQLNYDEKVLTDPKYSNPF